MTLSSHCLTKALKTWMKLSSFFSSDPLSEDHMIGYLPQYDKPYWVGDCDIPDGCEFKTAKEMFEANIFDGRSLKERWDDVVLVNIGGIR